MQDPTIDTPRLSELVAAFDWASTPLGPIEHWPQSLRTAVDLMLASGHAMQLAWGPAGTVIYNDAYAPMLGNRHPAALGLPFRDAWPEVWEQIEPLVHRVSSGETVSFESMPLVLTRHGYPEETWWNFSYSPVRDESGAVAGLLNVCVDASAQVLAQRIGRERDEANALLARNERRYRALVSAGAHSIYRMSPDWRFLHELDSRTLASTSGPLEHWAEKYILEADRPRVFAAIERAIRTRSLFTLEHRVRLADGSVGWVLSRAVPMFGPDGEIVEWFGAGADVTDRKRAEDALRESERRLATLVQGIPQLVWRAVDGGHWTWASPQWVEYTGLSLEASVGWGWIAALHPEDEAAVRAAWGLATERGGFEVECRVRRGGDRQYRWFQTRATPVRDNSGAIVEWLGTSTDIDDLRELQERQRLLVAELQHRTRNLMGVILALADRTGDASSDIAGFRFGFGDRLQALARVQGLLSRLEESDRIAFDELIRSELAAMAGAAGKVTLEGPSGIKLRSSMVQTLAMALHELATNALKYGALSQPGARLDIAWQLVAPDHRGRPRLKIDWRESGVKMPSTEATPHGSGQGRELIEEALPYQLDAETCFELGPDGVHCTITVPVSANTGSRHAHE